MNTPAHLLIGAAAMGRSGDRKLIWAGLIGGLIPDLSLYLMAGFALRVMQIPPAVVFDELYFSDAWQTVFAIDNSFILWGILLLLVLKFLPDKRWAVAVIGGALLHLALDFPLHHDDGRPHFWPLSNWIFESPLSYWDRRHGALWVGPIEAAIAVGCALFLWFKRPGWGLSILIGLLIAAQLMVARVWMFVFAG